MKKLFFIIAIVVITIFAFKLYNQSHTESLHNLIVLDLQQQNIIGGNSNNIHTEIRYLVITDKETFVCESSLFNGKFNNSDVFFRLKKDSTYNFKVAGVGKSFFFDYRNIIEVEK